MALKLIEIPSQFKINLNRAIYVWETQLRYCNFNDGIRYSSIYITHSKITTEMKDKFLASIRSMTETATATIVITTANTRLFVIRRFPPPVKPIRSTNKDITAWPEIDATVNIATPTIGTA